MNEKDCTDIQQLLAKALEVFFKEMNTSFDRLEERLDKIDLSLNMLNDIGGILKDVRSDVDAIKEGNKGIQKSFQDMLK